MPLYEYHCPEGHTREELRKYEDRDGPAFCQTCMKPMERIFSAHHAEVDGIYSYAPNEGSEEKFVRWNEKIAKQKEAAREARG